MNQPTIEVAHVTHATRVWLAPDGDTQRVKVTLYRCADGIPVAQIHMTNGAGMAAPRDPQMLPVPVWLWEQVNMLSEGLVYWAAESATTNQIEIWTGLEPMVDSGRTGALVGPYFPARVKCGVLIPDSRLVVTVHG